MGGKSKTELEGNKFLQIRTLAHRWNCSIDRIYDLVSKGVLKLWHPEKKTGCRGIMVEVESILRVEGEGYIE